MSITVVFDPPLPSDNPATFNTKAFTLLGDLNDWSTEANALAADVTTKQSTASTAATTASTAANTATTQAGISTTQAGIATSQASSALSSANAAAASATAADGSAVAAAASASDAAASAASVNPANFVQVTGNQAVGGAKSFSGSVAVGGSAAPAVSLDVQTTGSNALTSAFTTGITDLNFRLGAMNGVSGGTAGTTQGKLGLFYLGTGETATIDFRRGSTSTDGSLAFRTAGNDRATLDNSGNFTVTGQYNGSGAGLTNLPAAQITGNVAAAQIANALNASGSAPIYACRAWVNFNGTGTVAIRASGNVSSITDNGVGDYTVNFTTEMPDANYAPSFAVVQNATNGTLRQANVYGSDTASSGKTASSMRMATGSTAANALTDMAEINVAIFR